MTRNAWSRRALIAVLAACLSSSASCRSHQGYPGAARPYREVATVAAVDSGGGIVVIEKIDGAVAFHGFSGPDGRVDLLPGSYELQISSRAHPSSATLVSPPVGGAPMMVAIVPIAVETRPESDHDPRTIRLSVEAGHRYEIRTDPARTFYWIERYRVADPRPSPREQARHDPGLARCDLTPTQLDRDRCLAWVGK